MKKTILSFAVLALSAVGCDAASIEEELELKIDSTNFPIKVDTNCENGGCEMDGSVAFTIEFDADATLPEETEVEFLQYRIDYNMPGVSVTIPYHAGRMEVMVYPGAPSFDAVPAAGSKQRTYITGLVGGAQLNGTGLLTLAGYDVYDEQVFVNTTFEMAFGDFYDNTNTGTE